MDPAGLPDRLAGRAARGRAMAQARMTSRAAVRRETGATTQDESTGLEVPVWATVYTDLPFRLVGGQSHSVTVGGVEFEQATAIGHFPADTTDLSDDDLIDVTEGEWAGAVLSIVEAVKSDQATARRVPVVEAQRPAEWT